MSPTEFNVISIGKNYNTWSGTGKTKGEAVGKALAVYYGKEVTWEKEDD